MKKRRNILTKIGITGAAGHIGKVLTEGLSTDYELTLFDCQKIDKETSCRFKSIKVDLSKVEQVNNIFDGQDAVIHLAADPDPNAPWESVLTNNIVATYNVFEEARRADLSRIVFASTNHVQHGYTMIETPDTLDTSYVEKQGSIRLNDPPAPSSLYGVSKLFAEDLGWYYMRKYGIQFVALRIGATMPADDPSIPSEIDTPEYLQAMFLSKNDCVAAFIRALQVDTDYLVAYAISNNDKRVFDLAETREKLGFEPKDNAEAYFREKSNPA